jgi:hypothetical protein
MPALLSAFHLRRQDASERSLAGDPIEATCREMGCAKSGLYKGENRYETSKPTWFQERSRVPGSPRPQRLKRSKGPSSAYATA